MPSFLKVRRQIFLLLTLLFLISNVWLSCVCVGRTRCVDSVQHDVNTHKHTLSLTLF